METKTRPNEYADVEGIDILEAIRISNFLRKKAGEDIIHDLLPGTKHISSQCVLAKSFNCNVRVAIHRKNSNIEREYYKNTKFRKQVDSEYESLTKIPKPGVIQSDAWFAHFSESKYAEALANELGTISIPSESKTLFSVLLPKRVGLIARLFDKGYFPQYEQL